MITGKIDLTKIKNAKLIEKDGREFIEITGSGLFKGKSGARYLDLTLWETPGGEYGDWRITQDLGKDARAAGEKGAILGNGTNRGQGAGGSQRAPQNKGNQTGTLAPKDDADFNPPF